MKPPVHRVSIISQCDLANARATPISPMERTGSEPRRVTFGPGSGVASAHSVPGPTPELLGMGESEEEVEEGRVPKTRKFPEGMSVEELRTHSLIHIPYHPGCKHCVAGRHRDHRHPLRESGQRQMHAELQSSNGASICAD